MEQPADHGPPRSPEPRPLAPVTESFEAEDLQSAEALVQRVYPKTRLRESKRDFRFAQSTWSEGGVGFTRFRFSSWMDVAVEFEHVAAFGLLLGGDYAAESNGVRMDTRRPFLFAPGGGRTQAEHLDVLMVNIDTDVLASGAQEPRARGLVFEGTAPRSAAYERHWRSTLGYAWRSVVQVDELFRNDLIRTATFDAVVAAALAAFPIRLLAGEDGVAPAPSRAVRRAQEYIDARIGEALTVRGVAAAAGVSVRALQLAFRRDLDLAPLEYVRRRRLEAARTTLLAVEPGQVSVTELAHRWGWTNAGRFTAQYRALFGERPSDTARR